MCGIEILENVANQENMVKIVSDMKLIQRIRSLFQGQSSQLSEIFNTLLVHPNPNIGLKTLECIESWAGCQFKYQIFTDEGLVNNIILLLSSTDEDVFEKVAKIMLEGLDHSTNADILQTASVAQSLNLIRGEEIRSLKALIDALVLRVNDFLTLDQLNPESKFCKYYAEIATRIASKFSILILDNSEHSKKLIQLMVICIQHPNRSISNTTFEFWVSFYRSLEQYPNIQDPSSDWLIEPYLEVFKTVLEKCKLKKINTSQGANGDAGKKKQKKNYQLLKKYSFFNDLDDGSGFGFGGDFSSGQFKLDEFGNNDSGDDEMSGHQPLSFDLDQIDQNFAKIRVKEYRVFSREIFNTVYNVLNKFRGKQGVHSILQILYSLIDQQTFLAQNNFNDKNEATKQYYISVVIFLEQSHLIFNIFFISQLNIYFNFSTIFIQHQLLNIQIKLQLFKKFQSNYNQTYILEQLIIYNTNLINKKQYIFLIIHNFIIQNVQEVCLFVVQTMAENLFPSPTSDDNSQHDDNYSYFIEFIVNNNEFPVHQSTVNMAMQLIYNAQFELSKNAILFDSTIKFILRFILDENLGFMAAQTFSGIIKVGQNDQIDTFRYVAQFFISNIDKIGRQDVMDELIQGVFGFALNLKTPEHQLEAIQNLLSLVQQMLDNTKASIETIENAKERDNLLLRAIGILQSLLQGFSTEAISSGVKNSIATFVQQNFNFLTQAFDALTHKSNAQPIITQFINIFRFVTKIFNDQSSNLIFYEQYISFLNTSIIISQRNPILFCETMKIFKMILDLTKNSEYHSSFQQWLEQNFNHYNEFYIKFMTQVDNHQHSSHQGQYHNLQHQISAADRNKDPDLITNFYDIQLQVITYFSTFYLNHNSFLSVIEFSFDVVKNISQYEMTRQIILFYYEFIKHCSQYPQTQEFVLKILDTTIDILPNVNSKIMHNISMLFIKFVDINKDQCEQLREYIMKCFQSKEKYSQFSAAQKKILVDCIIKFSLEPNNLISLKSLLSDLYSVLKNIYSAQEMFMNYEMKLKGLNHVSNNTPNGLANNQNSSGFQMPQNFLNQLSNTLLARNLPVKNANDLDDLFN